MAEVSQCAGGSWSRNLTIPGFCRMAGVHEDEGRGLTISDYYPGAPHVSRSLFENLHSDFSP